MFEQPRSAHGEVLSNTRRRELGKDSAKDQHQTDDDNDAARERDVGPFERHNLVLNRIGAQERVMAPEDVQGRILIAARQNVGMVERLWLDVSERRRRVRLRDSKNYAIIERGLLAACLAGQV
jgi:hypothetical protein